MTSPKVVQAGDAVMLFLSGLCYSNRHLTDGLLTRAVVLRLWAGEQASALAMAARLVDAEMWTLDGENYRIHADYLKDQPTAEEVRQQRSANAERQARFRAKRKGARQARNGGGGNNGGARNAVTAGVTNGASNGVTNGPVTTPRSPTPYPKKSRSIGARPAPSEHGADSGPAKDDRAARPVERLPLVGLVQPPGRNVAVPGRVPLPASLFREFVVKVGGDENAARVRVQSWAVDVLARYDADEPIPGSSDNFEFWRQRAAEGLFGRAASTHADPRRRAGLRPGRRHEAQQDTWSLALAQLAVSVPSNQFQRWFSGTRIHEDRGDEIIVAVLDAGVGQSLQRLFAPAIEHAIEAIGRGGARVTFVAEDSAPAGAGAVAS